MGNQPSKKAARRAQILKEVCHDLARVLTLTEIRNGAQRLYLVLLIICQRISLVASEDGLKAWKAGVDHTESSNATSASSKSLHDVAKSSGKELAHKLQE